ncbi:MAG: radical SAM protein, partial [Planctomycetes bacterium]|nr:radical SAM protein [Planctomycetota bacterium]
REYGIRDLMLLDDNFILNRKKLFDTCDGMVKEKMNLTWYCMGHARFMTEERLRKIREAGCWFIEMGIESGCDRILKVLKKNTTKDEIAAAVRTARSVGLKVKGNFIFGLPTETKESLDETIDFAAGIGLSYFQQNFLTIWPGCELATDPERYGRAITDWGAMAHQRITFVPHGLTEEDLLAASRKAFRRFYLRPGVILAILASLRSPRALVTTGVAALTFLKTIGRRR